MWALCSVCVKKTKFLEIATRTFLLRLVGMTIFTNKTNNKIKVSYYRFQDLKSVGEYALGVVALAFLYDHLKDASRNHMSSMVGYMTLLQVCLFRGFFIYC